MQTETQDGLARTAEGSSNLYGFLATVYREEVSSSMMKRMKSEDFAAALAEAGCDLGGTLDKQPEAQLLEELAVEYAALFLGPGGHISPHESVQAAGASGRLWGPETDAVRDFIETHGFRYDEDFKGLPDHISVELDFLAELCAKEAEAWRGGDRARVGVCLDTEKRFLARHLGQWVEAFCVQVAGRAGHPFYRAIADLTADFVEAETEDLARRAETAENPAA